LVWAKVTRDQRRSVYRWHCRRFLVKNPHPTSDFQVIDIATSGLGLKSPCRKLPPGMQSFDNLAHAWHTPIDVLPAFSGASGHSPLIADQQAMSLIQ